MSRKRTAPASSPGIQLGMIITPMLDMAFQILAFFIMTYHPSALEAHIPGSLVPEHQTVRNPANPALPAEPPPLPGEKELSEGLEDAVIVKIKAIARGQEIGTRLAGAPSQIFLEQAPVFDAELIADVDLAFAAALQRLETRLKSLRKNKTHLKIAADGELRQQYVMAVYDTAKKAGFVNIHFVPPPVLKSKLK